MPITFRSARVQDFDYCRNIYFAEMEWIIDRLGLNRTAQEISFEEQWQAPQVRIIVFDGHDAGWLQTITQEAEVFMFSGLSLRLFLLDAGYPLVAMLISGAIIGAWKKKSAPQPVAKAAGA